MDILHSEPGRDPVTVSSVFNATPQRLFKAWTDPKELIKWFGPKPNCLLAVDVDLRVGGGWCFLVEESAEKKVHLKGEYLQIESDKTLIFSWSHVKEFPTGRSETTPFSQVTVHFTPVEQGTRLDLRHESVQTEDGRLGVGRGWFACVTNLQEHCEISEKEI